MSRCRHITILGGGPSGLATGYYAKKNNESFTIFERTNRIGGNSTTFQFNDFLFDSGAHRFHDKNEEITSELKNLLGEKLKTINLPSQIYYKGKFILFPFSPPNLLKNLGLSTSIKALIEFAVAKLRKGTENGTFENFAVQSYGRKIADLFLLNYSEKLWGLSCQKLSRDITGQRLTMLNLKTLLYEAIVKTNRNSKHLEGAFYYPYLGISVIMDELEKYCGPNNIQRNSRITKIFHDYTRIQAIEINNTKIIQINEVVSTLPITKLIQIMEPKLSDELVNLTNTLQYRNLILVAILLNKNSVTKSASVYFPNQNFPVTRIYEPKNRCEDMSPPGKTSLILEIPCHPNDELWIQKEEDITHLASSKLIDIGWIKKKDIIATSVKKIDYAYPIIDILHKKKLQKIFSYMKNYSNLKITGRNGTFQYIHIHDVINLSKNVVNEILNH